MKIKKGSINNPKGFQSTGISVGIKNGKKDLALIYSDAPVKAAAMFTKNIVKASSVLWNQKIIEKKKPVYAIIVNSGNANACTGDLGMVHTELMAKTVAEKLMIKKEEVFVASTGVIGVPLPIEKICNGVETLYNKLGNTKVDSDFAAEAIMTTDKVKKEIAVEFTTKFGEKIIRIGGIAKGSGMIHPNMATMLAFITTDVNISLPLLEKALKESVMDSYNMISVDGDTSTSDTVILMANGMANNPEIQEENEDYNLFKQALHKVNLNLAQSIIKDGEGATKFITVEIIGASTKKNAQILAKSIINSNLVKTAFFGEDANWGRILAAMGYSGADFDPLKVSITFKNKTGSIVLIEEGTPIIFDENVALKILKEKEISVIVSLAEGSSGATAWGCDLSYEYVKINADYRT